MLLLLLLMAAIAPLERQTRLAPGQWRREGAAVTGGNRGCDVHTRHTAHRAQCTYLQQHVCPALQPEVNRASCLLQRGVSERNAGQCQRGTCCSSAASFAGISGSGSDCGGNLTSILYATTQNRAHMGKWRRRRDGAGGRGGGAGDRVWCTQCPGMFGGMPF